jgi:hypothetical protein
MSWRTRHELGEATADEQAALELLRVLEHLPVRLRVGHRDRRLVRERLQHLEVLAGVRGLRALGPQHEQPAQPGLEA